MGKGIEKQVKRELGTATKTDKIIDEEDGKRKRDCFVAENAPRKDN